MIAQAPPYSLSLSTRVYVHLIVRLIVYLKSVSQSGNIYYFARFSYPTRVSGQTAGQSRRSTYSPPLSVCVCPREQVSISVCIRLYLSVCRSVCPSVCPSVCLSVYPAAKNHNKTVLQWYSIILRVRTHRMTSLTNTTTDLLPEW